MARDGSEQERENPLSPSRTSSVSHGAFFFMKSPPEQRHDEDAMASTEDFIAGRVER